MYVEKNAASVATRDQGQAKRSLQGQELMGILADAILAFEEMRGSTSTAHRIVYVQGQPGNHGAEEPQQT